MGFFGEESEGVGTRGELNGLVAGYCSEMNNTIANIKNDLFLWISFEK